MLMIRLVSGIISKAGAPFNATGNTILIDEVLQAPEDVDNATWGIKTFSGSGVITGNSIQGGYIGYYSKAGTTDFSNNVIKKSFIGLLSSGAEEMHHNTVEECYSHGMVMNGIKGPLHHNVVRNNAGSGIRVVFQEVDLGGGSKGSPGQNMLQGNGNYDLYIENGNTASKTLYTRYGIWDHTDPDEILNVDLYDARNPGGRPDVDFLPLGGLGMDNPELDESVKIYPNPASGQVIHIQSENKLDRVRLFSLSGEELISFPLNGEKYCMVNLSGVPAGCFFLSLRYTDGRIRVHKLERM
jgi:hypothetical protein